MNRDSISRIDPLFSPSFAVNERTYSSNCYCRRKRSVHGCLLGERYLPDDWYDGDKTIRKNNRFGPVARTAFRFTPSNPLGAKTITCPPLPPPVDFKKLMQCLGCVCTLWSITRSQCSPCSLHRHTHISTLIPVHLHPSYRTASELFKGLHSFH